VEEGVVVVVVLLLLLLLLLCSWLVIDPSTPGVLLSSPPLLSSLVYTSRDPNSALFRPSLFFRTDNTGAAHQTTHTHTQIGSWKEIKKILFQGSFRMGRRKTKFFLGGENQAGTAAAADWVVVLTRRDTKRFHGSNTGCWLVVVVVVLRLFVVWFSALMVIGCWQFPVRLGAAQEKRGAETTPTRETS
jgi:hypothetical protein